MAVGVILLISGFVVATHRHPPDPLLPAENSRIAAAASSAAASESAADAAKEARTLRVLVIGDSWTSGSDIGGRGPVGWPKLIEKDLTRPDRPVDVEESAAGGAGYADVGTGGATFPRLVGDAVQAQFDAVILFGSRNDTESQQQVQTGAQDAFTTVRQRFPTAKVIAIAPAWINDSPPAYLLSDRNAVRAAAAGAGAVFADPLAQHWFAGPAQALIGSDRTHPTDEGHRYLATRIEPILLQALGITG